MAPREYDFAEQLTVSQGIAVSANIRDVLMEAIPGAVNAYVAASVNDRMGVDWWVEMSNARHLAVDVKVRAQDWAVSHPQEDDLALETWSVIEAGKIGWTRDHHKRCDYVLWLWQDTKRFCLLPFPMLCRVMQRHWQSWTERHKVARQRTSQHGKTYHSECVFVPRTVIWREVYDAYGGVQRLTS
jgi:hypothetical protein